jgi:hypothetical protein
MRTQYRLLVLVCLLAGRVAVGQELGPGGSAGVDGQSSGNTLRIGAGVAIPLYKLFGPKKAKTLPVWDKYRTLELPDSLKGLVTDVPLADGPTAKPIQAVMSGGVSGTGGTGIGQGSRTNGDNDETAWTNELPPVTITAPSIPSPLPQPAGGGYPGFGITPPNSPPASVDPEPTDPNNQNQETPCQECLRLQGEAFQRTRTDLIYRAATKLSVGCAVAAAGAFVVVNQVGVWAHFIPGIGSATVELIATVGALAVDIDCLVSTVLGMQKDIAVAEAAQSVNKAQCPCK